MFKLDKMKLVFGLLIGAAMTVVIACGGDTETITVVETVLVPGDTVVETVVVPGDTITVVATATPVVAVPEVVEDLIEAPSTNTPAGTAVIAVGGDPIGDENGRGASQSPDGLKNVGIAETLFRRAADDTHLPWIATDFVISSDLSSATVTIATGIPFQVVDGYNAGDLTAYDVAWSMNDANSTTNPESIHGQAGDFAGLWGEWTAVDDTTITFNFESFDSTWKDDFVNQSGQAFSVFSQKAFEDQGEEWVSNNIVATGPYQVEEWLRDESYTIVNRPGTHWLAANEPKNERVQIVFVPEPTTRLALLRTGDVDIAALDPKDAAKLDLSTFGVTDSGGATQHGLFFSGNLWEDVYAGGADKGLPLPTKSTLVHDLPWIGTPGTKHGDDDLAQAVTVRKALALAIDRDLINDTLIAGLGRPVHVMYFSATHPNWDSKYEYAYDPDEAVSLIMGLDADYQRGSAGRDGILGANAFEISVYAQGGAPIRDEIAAAVAGFWQDIGLTTFALKFSYQTFRPTVVGRSNTHPWVTSCDKGNESVPWHFPKGLVQTTLTRGGFSCGFESPVILDLYQTMASAPDTATATAAADEYLEYVYAQNLQPGIVAVPNGYYMNNNKISSFEMETASAVTLNSVWNIVLK
ncbi:ABC transporter substrate-binding protein [Dehalococcoides mccartyi]|nr:ABC transporter substrate-binding protein [Dehalococcoides mccartyi]